MLAKRQYSDEEKAAALAALLAGQSLNSVAAEYRIPRGTLKFWRAKVQPSPVDPQKRGEISDLLIDYLRASLIALRAQAELFADRKWLQSQGAQEIGVLHGIMTDKAVRLLEAFSTHDPDSTAAD